MCNLFGSMMSTFATIWRRTQNPFEYKNSERQCWNDERERNEKKWENNSTDINAKKKEESLVRGAPG